MNYRLRVAVFADRSGEIAERIQAVPSLSVSTLQSPDENPAVAPDCIVCSDGVEDPVALVTRLDDRYPAVPIVVTPEAGSERLASRVLAAGADDYVPADDPDAIRSRVEAALEARMEPTQTGAREETTADGGAEREQILTELYDATQELLLATTPEEIATIAVETASEVLELPMTGVYLLDDDGESLSPAANTPAVLELFDRHPPAIPVDGSEAGRTFQDGEVRVFEDVRDSPDVHNEQTPIRTEIQVPIGDHGVLLTASNDRKEFATYQIDFLELLVTAVEAALQRSDRDEELRRYETVVRTIRDRVAVLDADGTIRMANQSLRSMVGTDDLQGRSIDEFLTGDGPLRGWIESLDPGESTTLERTITARDGSQYPCELDLVALPAEAGTDGVVCVVRDISDRKRIQAALEEQQDRFAELFDTVPDPVVELRIEDGQANAMSVNDAFESTFGCDGDTVRGCSLGEFLGPGQSSSDEPTPVDLAASTAQVEAQLERETTEGIRHFLFRRVPVDTDTDTEEAFGIYTDITEQRTRQRRLEVLNRVLRHNLRNDVNVILSAAEGVQVQADDSATVELAETIEAASGSLARLGEQVRTAESALDRTGATTTQPVDRLVDGAIDTYREHEELDLSASVPDVSLPAIDDRLRVAIEQLLRDACAHGDSAVATVDISVQHDDDALRVRVVDRSRAVPDSDLDAVRRGAETPLEHGSGLGLWLVDWLVTSIGGRIQFGDDPDGTVFELVFPNSVLEG